MPKLSYIPDKATMAGWTGQCRNIQKYYHLIADLKLTIPQIRDFARYLGIRLRGCRYLKVEIVCWLINASLDSKLRSNMLVNVVREKKRRCSMKDYSSIQIYVTSSY